MAHNKRQYLEPQTVTDNTTRQDSATINVKPIYFFGVASIVVLVALAATVTYIFFHEDRTPDTYVVVVVLLFFALTTASSLLFANSSSIKGDMMGVTVSVMGPAALWFIGMLMFFKLLPPNEVFDSLQGPQSIQKVGEIAANLEKQLGWLTYSEWKEKQTTVDELFDEQEYSTMQGLIGILLDRVKMSKVDKAHIATIIIYLPKDVIKIQRIRGSREKTDAFIRFKSRGTSPNAKANSAFFVATNSNDNLRLTESFSDITPKSSKGFAEISSDPVDCLIVTLYDDPVEEDFMVVNPKRFSNYETVTIDLAVVSLDPNMPITDRSLWSIKPAPFFAGDETPVFFRQEHGAETDGKQLLYEIASWLETLDLALENNKNMDKKAKGVLTQMLAKLRDSTKDNSPAKLPDISNLLKDEKLMAYRFEEARHTTMLLLQRGS